MELARLEGKCHNADLHGMEVSEFCGLCALGGKKSYQCMLTLKEKQYLIPRALLRLISGEAE